MGSKIAPNLDVQGQTGTYVFVSCLTVFSYSSCVTPITTNINHAVSSVSSYICGTVPPSPNNLIDEHDLESKLIPGPVAHHSSERQNLRIPSDRDHTSSYHSLVLEFFNSMDIVYLYQLLAHRSGQISPVQRRPKTGEVFPVHKRPKDDRSVFRRSNITKQREESTLIMQVSFHFSFTFSLSMDREICIRIDHCP